MKYEYHIKNKEKYDNNKRIHSTNEEFTIIFEERIEIISNIDNKICK